MSLYVKHIALYIFCILVLVLGFFFGIKNISRLEENENSFWANKRVEYSQYLPGNGNMDYDKNSADYFISEPVFGERSAEIVRVHNVKTAAVGEIVPLDVLFQNECNFFSNEYESGKTGCVTFFLDESEKNGFISFIFDLNEYCKNRRMLIIRECLVPVMISTVVVFVLLLFNIYALRKKLFKPINAISRLSKNICCGDFSQDYLKVNPMKSGKDEVSNLVCSFELMRDEIKSKQETAERLRQAEKELISCMSHDLQTPLSTTKAYAEALRDNVAHDDEERKAFTEVILKKINTMIDMIKDLLTYSNSQLGQLSIDFEEIMLRDFFDPLLVELKNYAKQKEIELRYSMTDSNVLLHIDPKRMTQVLYNLVENSMKYMDKPQKEIDMHVKVLEGSLHIRVADNGIGINSEEILFIFDKFYRAEKSRTSSVPGSGLGLSICKYIVEQHSGEIWCESEAGVGTTFYIVLPIKEDKYE